jgi:hypothetical protein
MFLARWAVPTGATEESPSPVSVTPSGFGGCLGGREPGTDAPGNGCVGLSGLGLGWGINRSWASDGELLGRVLGQPLAQYR